MVVGHTIGMSYYHIDMMRDLLPIRPSTLFKPSTNGQKAKRQMAENGRLRPKRPRNLENGHSGQIWPKCPGGRGGHFRPFTCDTPHVETR